MENDFQNCNWRRIFSRMILVTGFLFLTWTPRIAQCHNCPPNILDEIQSCVVPVAQFAEALGVDVLRESNDRLIPNMGAEVFRELCVRITAFSNCAQNAKHQCPNHLTLALINASYGYLCTEGYDIFMKNADCLMRLDQEPLVRSCHDRTMNTIKNVSQDQKTNMPQKLMVMCNALNYFALCVEKPVLNECGSVAWAVIERVLRDTTRTLVPTCMFSDNNVLTYTFEPPTAHPKKYLNDEQGRRLLSTPKSNVHAIPSTRAIYAAATPAPVRAGLEDSDKGSANVASCLISAKRLITVITLSLVFR